MLDRIAIEMRENLLNPKSTEQKQRHVTELHRQAQ
jgi:hypothetical protein